jgi:hypothetical protein
LNTDEIVGQIKNLDDDPVEFIKIGVTGYDADGIILLEPTIHTVTQIL